MPIGPRGLWQSDMRATVLSALDETFGVAVSKCWHIQGVTD